jgi:hypothetical protein
LRLVYGCDGRVEQEALLTGTRTASLWYSLARTISAAQPPFDWAIQVDALVAGSRDRQKLSFRATRASPGGPEDTRYDWLKPAGGEYGFGRIAVSTFVLTTPPSRSWRPAPGAAVVQGVGRFDFGSVGRDVCLQLSAPIRSGATALRTGSLEAEVPPRAHDLHDEVPVGEERTAQSDGTSAQHMVTPIGEDGQNHTVIALSCLCPNPADLSKAAKYEPSACAAAILGSRRVPAYDRWATWPDCRASCSQPATVAWRSLALRADGRQATPGDLRRPGGPFPARLVLVGGPDKVFFSRRE